MLKPSLIAAAVIAATEAHSLKLDQLSTDNNWTGKNTFSNVTTQASTEYHFGTELHYGPAYHLNPEHFRGGAYIEFDPTIGSPALWFSQAGRTVGLAYAFNGGGFNFYSGTNFDTGSGFNPSQVVSLNNGIVYAGAVVVDGGGVLVDSSAPESVPALAPGQIYLWSSNGVACVTTCSRSGVVRTTAFAGSGD